MKTSKHQGPVFSDTTVWPQGLGVRQPSVAFDHPRLPKRQRAGALQDADAHYLHDTQIRGADFVWPQTGILK